MISSAISACKPAADLASAREEEILKALIEYIDTRTDEAKRNLTKVLSQLITTSYLIGGDKAAREIGHRGPLGLQGLEPVAETLGTHLDSTFGNLGGELTGVIRGGLQQRWSYDHVQQALADKIKAGWGKSITFQNIGKVRDAIQVNPDGTLKRIQVTIEKPVTLSADTYAQTLARTSMKQAYAAGHWTRYQEAGCTGWIYVSVADERTRPRHLALHGRLFLYGTDDETMARQVMSEYNCRCRPKAYFGDPKLDRPDDEYAAERKEWSTQTFDEWKVDKNMPLLVQEQPQSRRDLRNLVPQLKDRMDTNDWKILAYQIGLTQEELAKNALKTIDKNFFFRTLKSGEKENTAVHVYRGHILNDITQSGEQPFTMAEVIKAKDEGIIYKHRDAGGEKLKALWKTPDGRMLNVIMSNQYPGKIVTAYRIGPKDWNKIVREGEKIAR